MRFEIGVILLALVVLGSCTPEPKTIAYGTDACQFCRMTIVDQKHAAQLVTQKTKAFSFDAVECMLNYLKDMEEESVALYLVSDFEQPGNLTDATKATYLISKNIPSPMGANLSAFKSGKAAQTVQDKHGGNLYSWQELLTNYTR